MPTLPTSQICPASQPLAQGDALRLRDLWQLHRSRALHPGAPRPRGPGGGREDSGGKNGRHGDFAHFFMSRKGYDVYMM